MLVGTVLMTIAGVLVNYFGEAKGQPLFILRSTFSRARCSAW